MVCGANDSVRSRRCVSVVGRVDHTAVQELESSQWQKIILVFAIGEFRRTGRYSCLGSRPGFLVLVRFRSKSVEAFTVKVRAESHNTRQCCCFDLGLEDGPVKHSSWVRFELAHARRRRHASEEHVAPATHCQQPKNGKLRWIQLNRISAASEHR